VTFLAMASACMEVLPLYPRMSARKFGAREMTKICGDGRLLAIYASNLFPFDFRRREWMTNPL
jgi:hypothetical protein